MSDEPIDQPPVSGGGLKYAIVGIVLFAIAGGVYFATQPAEAPPPPAVSESPDAGVAAIERPTSLADQEFEMPEELPDGGVGAVETPAATGRAPRTDGGGAVAPGGWRCSGDIPVTAVRSTIGANSGQVRQCYERRLRVDPNIGGTLRVQMRVGSGGSVNAVNVSGSLHDPEVLACVRERVRQWRFQAPAGGDCAVVAAPFTLTPRQ